MPTLPPDAGFYLNFEVNWPRTPEMVSREDGQAVLATGVPVYVEGRAEGRRGLRLTYWLLYGHDVTPWAPQVGSRFHEGDWERVSVLVRREDASGAYTPVSVRYHPDRRVATGKDLPWADVERVADGDGDELTHPVVYAARDSHTPYPRAGSFDVVERVDGRRTIMQDNAASCDACPEWRTWEDVRDASQQPWYGFGGAWGLVWRSDRASGPLGPSRYKLAGEPVSLTSLLTAEGE